VKRLPPNAARIGIVAAILVAINIAARVVARVVLHGDHSQVELALWSLVAMVVVVGVAGFVWTSRRRVPIVSGDLFFAIVIASVLVTALGQLVSGHADYSPSAMLRVFALCVGGQAIGAAAGVLIAVTFGLDPTSRAWRSQSAALRKPARR
jgi:hypothetical protein